ncbi:hypothetical protein ACFFU1_14615 [Algibacter miyuki]|uniref:Uncharacterized protein n=1 Tax=Algibacter miyuki TaxID=1306933 RepID=A0ABV5H2N7_9FLAO|nr:hypothetical protein [Algibacter miyuki]MDN3664548.1 hypothetical protein [Algibacter miyuki]
MRIKILYIGMMLCFAWNMQAQDLQVASLEHKVASFSAEEKESLSRLINGTPQKLFVTKENGVFRHWEVGNVGGAATQVVEVENPSLIHQFSNAAYTTDFNAAKVLVLYIDNLAAINLTQVQLDTFKNLQVILIRSYNNISVQEVESKFKNLALPESLEIIVEQLKQAN